MYEISMSPVAFCMNVQNPFLYFLKISVILLMQTLSGILKICQSKSVIILYAQLFVFIVVFKVFDAMFTITETQIFKQTLSDVPQDLFYALTKI